MKVNIYRLTDQKLLEPLLREELTPSWPEDEVHRWIDIETGEKQEIQDCLIPLNLPAAILKACMEPGHDVYIAPYDRVLYLEVPIQVDWKNTRPTYLSIVCLPTTLVTVHQGPVSSIARVATNFSGDMRLNAANTSTLLYHIFDHLADQHLLILSGLRKHFESIVDTFLNDPYSIETKDLLSMRQPMLALDKTLQDQLYCADALLREHSQAFSIGDQRGRLSDLIRSMERVLRLAEQLGTDGRYLYQLLQVRLQEGTNNRLRLLTIISAVFLPLTLISGIYGMNFSSMPGVELTYGFPVTMGVMGALAAGMLWIFRRGGWFR